MTYLHSAAATVGVAGEIPACSRIPADPFVDRGLSGAAGIFSPRNGMVAVGLRTKPVRWYTARRRRFGCRITNERYCMTRMGMEGSQK